MASAIPKGSARSSTPISRCSGRSRRALLSGTVTVQRRASTRSAFEPSPDLFNLAGGTRPRSAGRRPAPTLPLRVRHRTSTRRPRCASRTTSRAWSRAPTCSCRAPTIGRCSSGRAEIERGDVIFEGNRYLVTRGTIDFFNPSRIEPFFDIEAETRVRVPGQTVPRDARLHRHDQPDHATAELRSAAAEWTSSRCSSARTIDLQDAGAAGAAPERGAAVRGGAAARGPARGC